MTLKGLVRWRVYREPYVSRVVYAYFWSVPFCQNAFKYSTVLIENRLEIVLKEIACGRARVLIEHRALEPECPLYRV